MELWVVPKTHFFLQLFVFVEFCFVEFEVAEFGVELVDVLNLFGLFVVFLQERKIKGLNFLDVLHCFLLLHF